MKDAVIVDGDVFKRNDCIESDFRDGGGGYFVKAMVGFFVDL